MLNSDVTFKRQVKPIMTFSDEDLAKLFCGLKNKNSNFVTTFYLLIYTDLRPSDIFELKVDDIDTKNKILSYYA